MPKAWFLADIRVQKRMSRHPQWGDGSFASEVSERTALADTLSSNLAAGFDEKLDRRPLFAVDLDVDKGGDTHQVDTRWCHVTPGDGDRLDGLIDRTGADSLQLTETPIPNRSGDGSGDTGWVGGRGYLEQRRRSGSGMNMGDCRGGLLGIHDRHESFLCHVVKRLA